MPDNPVPLRDAFNRIYYTAAGTLVDQDTNDSQAQARAARGMPIAGFGSGNYETIAASQSDQVLGTSGAAGDFLVGLLVVPASTSPGAVSIKDGGGSAITVFAGGANSTTNLVPFFIPLGIACGTAWKVTTGASLSAIAVGSFT